MRAARALIDISALQHNLAHIRRLAPGRKVMAMLKANGYGHGLVRVGHALKAADALGVACVEEALELRDAGIENEIVVLEGFFASREIPLMAKRGFTTVVHHEKQLAALEETPTETPLKVWLKIDTGMHRLGFPPEQVPAAHERLSRIAWVQQPVGLLSHLASADEIENRETQNQLQLFKQLTRNWTGERSLANSAAVLAWPETHFDWVRPGLLLFGCSPLPGHTGAAHGLQPVMTLESQVFALRELKKGDRVGYGGAWTAERDTVIGVVAMGYGDGYPRHAPAGTPVFVKDRLCPLVGRVSMDMLTVDLGPNPDIAIGERAVLWGPELPIETVAEAAGTISYDLLCAVTPRVPFSSVNEPR
ncbi:alanine racemase [Permianibacter sp. IMCC34836]|uniref:alanine racemase n=1 Tax=Permianibacter fluminis TaxID=2738515 RepID=UPI0015530338|nr:alanine racemase [Permianibacter fluminis]NQD36623.1 alanine racemase [Permianibacter fluminis]